MNLTEFQDFATSHKVWLTGPIKVPLTQIQSAEEELQVKFPLEFTWLLTEYGIWSGTGVQALQWIVSSTKRLASKKYIVLSRTTVGHFDDWQGSKNSGLSPKSSGYVVMELAGKGVSGKVIWLRECLHVNLLKALELKDQPLVEFDDFSEFIKYKVEKLAAESSIEYQQCPYQKSLPETPLVVHEQSFPWEFFMERLGETISWNLVRNNYALELPDDLIDHQYPNWIDQLVYIQEVRRHMLLAGGYKPDSYYAMIGSSCRPIIKPAENLAGGDLLLTKIVKHQQQVLPKVDGLTTSTTAKPFIFDAWGRPAYDYWIGQLLLSDNQGIEQIDSNEHFLVSWIPPGLYPKTDNELKQFGFHNNLWLEHGPEILLRHFKDRRLISA